ncbi:MAG: hypothetical protein ACRDH9_08990 [Actinomycetota bacterium]
MLLFRSEEHLDRWCQEGGRTKAGVLTLEQLWGLASVWYRGRTSPDWRRRTAEEAETVFSSLGLTGEFWRLT